MKRRGELPLFFGMLAAGAVLYAARWLLFPGEVLHNEMWRFLLGDVAFLFIQVALVTLVLDELIESRERAAKLVKLNMVIGAFFSEAGTRLLRRLATTDLALEQLAPSLRPTQGWGKAEWAAARAALDSHEPRIDIRHCDLRELKASLAQHKAFFLGLLGNQNLLEHESFTELLWALTHLAEELDAREDLSALNEPDRVHLSLDAKRAYTQLIAAWLGYLAHLQTAYPYLFSLAVRTNPLDPGASAVVSE